MTREKALQTIYTKRVKAFSALHSLAESLNDGWKPDWLDTTEEKYYIATDFNTITVHTRKRYAAAGMIFFKEKTDAEQAIEDIDTELLFDNVDTFIEEIGWDSDYAILPTSKEMLDLAKDFMKENGFITTLDLKKKLRADNLFMTQNSASESLTAIAEDMGWPRKPHGSGRYMIYTEN